MSWKATECICKGFGGKTQVLIYVVRNFALSVIRLFEFLLLARAISSWFPQVSSGQIGNFLYMCTEPLLVPVRKLLSRVSFLQNLPIDFSVLAAFFLLEFISTLLYVI